MRFSTLFLPVLAAGGVAAGKGKSGGRGSGNGNGNTGSTGSTGTTTAGNSTANTGGVVTSSGNTPVNQLGVGGGQAGGALNAGASGAQGPNGLPQLANPMANFDATTSKGTFGPFTPVSQAVPGATGAPTSVDASTAQALQAASDNWSFDTSQVSNFLNTGKSLNGNTFNQGANIGYNAEVDELTHKAILDSVIGNDPDVSIANQTLTNGVFQSVVNNLQVMADQGAGTQQLIDFINSVRCTQILPSIDTYMAVAARVIGQGATLRTAIRPDACKAIVAAAPNSAFPGNLQAVNVRSNTDQTTNNAPQPNPNQGQVSPQFTVGAGATGSTGTTGGTTGSTTGGTTGGTTGTNTGTRGGKGNGGAGAGGAGKGAGKGAGGFAKGKNKFRRAIPFSA